MGGKQEDHLGEDQYFGLITKKASESVDGTSMRSLLKKQLAVSTAFWLGSGKMKISQAKTSGFLSR